MCIGPDHTYQWKIFIFQFQLYLEHQMLGWRFVCPIGPATQREFILDWRICRVLLTIQMKLILLYVWAEWAVLGSAKTT